ncbi:MAG: tetratricopeptide repeat protein [Gammaproteobacteria bacterium]
MTVFKELFARRVPQLLGLYVAGTWMAIEIGDWLIEKFGLPESITAYIFIALAAMLPAVAVVAWFHGAPGKDQWTKVEKTVVPLNLMGAALALFFLNPQPLPDQSVGVTASAIETRTVVDETGVSQSFEVPVEAFHKNVTLYFLPNETGDASNDWLSYALPLLIEHDLNHETPLVSAATPFGSDSLLESLRTRGFDDAVGEPRSLQLTLVRERRGDALVSGALVTVDEQVRARVRLIDVSSGSVLAEMDEDIADLLSAADRISMLAQQQLDIDPKSDTENDPLTDNLSGKIDAVRRYVDARIAVALRNDYAAGVALLEEAIQIDDSFAQAYGELANLYYLSGNVQQAKSTVLQALNYDYKLSTASRFQTKTRRYLYDNDFDRSVKVLSMWTEVDPQNPRAFEGLGSVLMITGQNHAAALAAFEKALALNPGSYSLYSSMASVEQGRGNLAAAAQHIQSFLDARPDDAQAHLHLARIYVAAGDYDRARQSYLDAELLFADDLGATLGLAALALRTGEFPEARKRIDDALARELTAQQRLMALNARAEFEYVRGKLNAMLATLGELDALAAQIMPPLMRIVQVGMTAINTKTLLGDFDGALATIDDVTGQIDAPLDGFLNLPRVGVEWEKGDIPAALASLDRAEAFVAQLADPTFDPMMAYARVVRFVIDDDAQGTRQQVDTTLDLMDRSFFASMNTSVFVDEIRVDLARMLRRVGAVSKAKTLLDDALRLNPFLATAHLEMAYIWHSEENSAQALQSLEQAMAIWSDADADYRRHRDAKGLQASLRN